MSLKENINKYIKDKEFLAFLVLFAVLWAYIFIRVNTVFYIYDEIHTKWIYMVDWNFMPYEGYVDANNHFLNSFLGGLFIRLFNSDAMWVVRLPSLLAFPVYFWSIYGCRNIFRNRTSFYLFAALFLFSAFLLDYFGMSRGYGLSIAFLMMAMQQTMAYLSHTKFKFSIGIVCAWVLAISSNLTLIPFAMAGIVFVLIYQVLNKKISHTIPLILAFAPIFYLVQYSFHLKEIGKLYYGGQDGFFVDTVHSLTPYLWWNKSLLLDLFLTLVFIGILVLTCIQFLKDKRLFEPKLLFSYFLILSVFNILGQHYLLGINFPEDRSALYLIVFFFGAFSFGVDYFQNRTLNLSIVSIVTLFFLLQLNFTHSIFFSYEHFDEKLLTEMNEEVQGIPPSSGGRFWTMDNELTRTKNLKGKTLQEMRFPADTILDYLVTTKGLLPDYVNEIYHEKYVDQISNLILYDRKAFLKRKKVDERITKIGGIQEFYGLWEANTDKAHFIRLSGYLKGMNIHRKSIIIFNTESKDRTITNYSNFYNLVESMPINENGEIHFDFTVALNDFPDSSNQIVFYWNPNKFEINGLIKAEVYEILE